MVDTVDLKFTLVNTGYWFKSNSEHKIYIKNKMDNKSKKLLKLGNFVYGNKIQLLLIDTDKLLFLKKYKNLNNLIKIGLNDKRIYHLFFELIKYKIKFIDLINNDERID